MPNEEKVIFVEVPEEDHRYFKIACARKGITIKQDIRNHVHEVAESERPDRKEEE